jgi:hypothetical protein
MNLGSGDFTFESFMFLDASTATDNMYRHVVHIGDQNNYFFIQKWRSGISNGLLAEYAYNGNRYCITPAGADPQPRVALGTYTLYDPTNKWSHIVVSVISNVMRLYINGAMVGSVSLSASQRWSSNMPIRIGRGSMTTNEFFKGRIPVVRVYKGKGLTDSEVLFNFNQNRVRYGI